MRRKAARLWRDAGYQSLGRWLTQKYQAQQAAKGTYQAALNMKKQGIPIEYALQVLTGQCWIRA